ncbi:MAG: ATPase [Treponema sp.]|jgi:hypothetical protein|nr:ATPase [Treponema sp.]
MEELQSTEVLDQEILEDARKKAFRIIKNADDTVTDNAHAWEGKIKDALNALRQKYADKIQKNGVDIMRRLVQDKRRARSIKIEELLKTSINGYLSSLDKKTLLALLERELTKRLDELNAEGTPITEEDEPEVMLRAITEKEAESLLENAFFKNFKELKKKRIFWTIRKPNALFLNAGIFPAIVINTRKVKVTASIDDAEAFLLEDKRAELTAALLGEAFLESIA